MNTVVGAVSVVSQPPTRDFASSFLLSHDPDLEADEAVLTVDYVLDRFLLTSTSSYSAFNGFTLIDVDASSLQVGAIREEEGFEQASQELRIASEPGGRVESILGWLETAKFVEFLVPCVAGPADPECVASPGGDYRDERGQDLNTPDLSGSLGLDYSAGITPALDWRARLDVNYRSDTIDRVNRISGTESVAFVNARVALTSKRGWSLALTGNNLTDERFIASRIAALFPAPSRARSARRARSSCRRATASEPGNARRRAAGARTKNPWTSCV